MKKIIAFVLALVCVLGLVGCYNRPNTPNALAEIEVDRVIMLHSSDGGASGEKVIITDKETISELVARHNCLQTNSLQTNKPNEVFADEQLWVIFCQGDKHIAEWFITVHGDDWSNARFITYSTMLDESHQVIKNTFDYNGIVEIFNAVTDQPITIW